uniref:Uncharacterized protein n=1 Tax=Peronospora matthiolae TaxID=2874970 RepID=A0AAV1VNP5_9STRA
MSTLLSFQRTLPTTGYNLTTSKQSVQEVYVEEAGRACFLGAPNSGDGFGVCYSDNVPVVDDRYQDSISEVMLFKTDANDFDVIVYDNEYYNERDNSLANEGAVGLQQRFTGFSKILKRGPKSLVERRQEPCRSSIRSIKFVRWERGRLGRHVQFTRSGVVDAQLGEPIG